MDGLYTILDVGGGTVDFAVVLITRSNESGRVVKFITQSVMPLGVEVLLKKLHVDLSAEEYEIEKKRLKDENPIIKYVANLSSLKDPKKVLPYRFRIGFFQKILDAKRVCCVQMDQLYDKGRGIFPLYVYGGGSDYRWYDAIVGEQNRHILKCNIPPLTRKNKKNQFSRLAIAANLAKIGNFNAEGNVILDQLVDELPPIVATNGMQTDYHLSDVG